MRSGIRKIFLKNLFFRFWIHIRTILSCIYEFKQALKGFFAFLLTISQYINYSIVLFSCIRY
ncbi:hypothetical protein HMPREF0766_13029 [Sphingobacterium spiritivorum ATCC 33861]|uniref:Uncharacterized protein n=1 Tax=Sphingobacterium spiritivorum ATCC 33861 TaxID=525373 RepID=D7VPV9_SPHSI|nr:hypothetical protein HMPREF0766_13029 [Sphingobacterium spiritivorum ATCC 33861]